MCVVLLVLLELGFCAKEASAVVECVCVCVIVRQVKQGLCVKVASAPVLI